MPNSSDPMVFEHVPCTLCGADDFDVLLPAREDRKNGGDPAHTFRASSDELLRDQLVRCQSCGLQYVTPRLRAELILDAYRSGEDAAYVSQVRARERTFAASLKTIERYVGKKGRLLDIGTAAGAFVAAARARGWDAEGCEPNEWLAEWGRRHYGVPVHQGSVFDQQYEPGTFDVITLWDVIEHTPDPRAVLEQCRLLLKPEGLLVVNFPDIGSWVARVMGRRWLFLSSVHLYYFDRSTMGHALAATGFDVRLARPHVQWLELDYILGRGRVLSEKLAGTARRVAGALKLHTAHVPYWFGQTFIVAKRTGLQILLWLELMFPRFGLELSLADLLEFFVGANGQILA